MDKPGSPCAGVGVDRSRACRYAAGCRVRVRWPYAETVGETFAGNVGCMRVRESVRGGSGGGGGGAR